MIIFGIQLSTSDIWLLGICGTLIMSLVVYRLTLNVKRYSDFNSAAYKFTNSFVDEIRFIDYSNNMDRVGKDIPEILRVAYDGHESAYLIFRNNLGWINKIRIEKAWKKYTGEDKYLGKPTFSQYTTDGIKNRIKNNDKIALKNLNAVLKFAKHK